MEIVMDDMSRADLDVHARAGHLASLPCAGGRPRSAPPEPDGSYPFPALCPREIGEDTKQSQAHGQTNSRSPRQHDGRPPSEQRQCPTHSLMHELCYSTRMEARFQMDFGR